MTAAPTFEISVDALAQRRDDSVVILDVRESWELDICRVPDSLCIPLTSLPGRLEELPRDGMLVVLCHHGMRSAHAVQWLRANGFPQAVNLAGGIDAWARQIDPAMRTY